MQIHPVAAVRSLAAAVAAVVARIHLAAVAVQNPATAVADIHLAAEHLEQYNQHLLVVRFPCSA